MPEAARVNALIALAAGLWLFPGVAAPDEGTYGESVPTSLPSGRNVNRLIQLRDDDAHVAIDGRLDEEAWNIPRINQDMRVISPDTLDPAPAATDVRAFYTERGLYLSVDMEQQPTTLIERHTVRDNTDENRDRVSIVIDTSGTGLYGYWFSVALGDDLADGTLLPERRYVREWDGAWTGASSRTARGWSAELFVPWSQVSMPKAENERRIGIYASRKVAHLSQSWAWPAYPRTQVRFLSVLPSLELTDVDPRQQWSVFPFAAGTYDRIDAEPRYKVGADMLWRPTSNSQLSATINPDFGTVEADDVVVNLTADEVFFPEKRLFFLEGQDVFTATPRAESDTQRFSVINTRRVGGRPPSPDVPPGVEIPQRQLARPSDLLGAAKVTGQAGPVRFGLLTAFEDDTNFYADDQVFQESGRDFAALRLLYERRRGAGYRGIGLLSTLVSHPDTTAIVHSVDGHFRDRSGRWSADGQLLASDRTEAGNGYGAYADITYSPRQGLIHTLELTAFDDTLDVNDFGYQRRNDFRGAWYRLDWTKSGLRRVRDFTLSPYVRHEVNGDGYRTAAEIGSKLKSTLNNLDSIEATAAWFPASYDDRNSFGNGTYEVSPREQLKLTYRTNTSKPLSVSGNLAVEGEQTGGQSYTVGAGLTWQPQSQFKVDATLNWLDRNGWLLHQEDTNFTAFDARQWQPSLRADYFPSARQQLSLAFQWVGIRARAGQYYELPPGSTSLQLVPVAPDPADDFSLSQLSFQVRYRWQIAPLSDLFVVYTKGDSGRGPLAEFSDLLHDSWKYPLGDQFVVKLRYRVGS